MYAEVILKNSLFETFTYKIPDGLRSFVKESYAVYVPLKNSVQIGFVKRIINERPSDLAEEKIKSIIDIFPLNPIFAPLMFELLLWSADYYIEPPGSMIFSAIPSGIFRLTNYRLVLKRPFSGLDRDVINLAHFDTLKKKYNLTLLDIHRIILNGEGYLEVIPASQYKGDIVELTDMSEERLSSPELQKVVEKYPALEVVIEELRMRGRIPLYDILTVLRDKRIMRYLYKSGLIRICGSDIQSGAYRVKESNVIELTEEQRQAIERIEESRKRGFGVHYIYGITGSGKTEVYLRVAEKVLKEGKSILFLVPEIGLTPQSINRIRSSLGCDVAVLHSALDEKERIREYFRVRDKKVGVVVGARSAVFAPLSDLGLIIVDEEHDNAYKQEESPRYNGRDIAIKRAQIEGCMVILGSATPSVQSLYNIRTGKFDYSRLTKRANKRPLPEIEIVSLSNKEKGEAEDVEGLPFFISERLYRALIDTVARNRKAILMLNRRGYNTILLCGKCGYIFRCPDCDINLVYHKKADTLLCHYCNYTMSPPSICPSCGSVSIKNFGFGTEQVEEAIKRFIPGSKTVRLDRDSVSNLYDLESIISKFSSGEANILIGTQMVAKGHHFPDVTLVGVILADTAFSIPDFRVQERLMQLLMQVAGRAGRGDERGEVIIQTFNPFEPSILAVKNQNPDEYLNVEIARRKNLFYPPFSRIILIRARSKREERCVEVLNIFRNHLKGLKRSEILGPAPCPVRRISNEFRYQLMIKTLEMGIVRNILKNVIPDVYRVHHNVRVNIDVDPLNML